MRRPVIAHGRKYIIDVTDTENHVDRVIRRWGRPYELPLLEHIWRLGLSGTAVDVGANIGNHALWFAAVCGLRVEAFEPVFAVELARNVEINNLGSSITVHPVGLGDSDATAEHVGPHGRLSVGEGEIPLRRLDDYPLTDVALIKIDVEGMEAAVLRGAEQTIREHRPVIFAEEWDSDPRWHQDIADVLSGYGYRMTYRFDKPEAWTPMGKWEPARRSRQRALPSTQHVEGADIMADQQAATVFRAGRKSALRKSFRAVQDRLGVGATVVFANWDERHPWVEETLQGLYKVGAISQPELVGADAVATIEASEADSAEEVRAPFSGPVEPAGESQQEEPETELQPIVQSEPAPQETDQAEASEPVDLTPAEAEATGARDYPEPPPRAGSGSGAEAWRDYAEQVTDIPGSELAVMSRADIIAKLEGEGIVQPPAES